MNWIWIWILSIAHADLLQTPPLESKKEADKILSISKRMLRKEKGVKVKRGRFLVPKRGYRYRVVVEGVSDGKKAIALATRLQSIWSDVEMVTDAGQMKRFDGKKNVFLVVLPEESGISVIREEKKISSSNEEVEPKKADRLDISANKKGLVEPKVSDILNYATKSMEVLVKKWETVKTEKFVFERELLHEGKKVRVHHRFFKKGDAMRLEIEMKEGEGENSTTVLTPSGKGLLSVQDKKQERSAARTQEILKTFSSYSQLSILLRFPKDVESNGPWRSLDGVEHLQGAWRLFPKDEELGGTIKQAVFSEKEGWLIQLVVQDEEGELEYRWTDYTDLGDGTFVPFRITRIRNGYVQETIKIENLYFGIEIDDALFALE
jgi:hypothetical protein